MVSMEAIIRSTVAVLCIAKFVSCQYYVPDHYSEENDGDIDDGGFVTALDFTPLFSDGNFGAYPTLKYIQEESQDYHPFYDVRSSESRIAPGNQQVYYQPQAHPQQQVDRRYSQNYGYTPQSSQKLESPPPKRYQENTVEIERTKAVAKSSGISSSPLKYTVETTHDYIKDPQPNKDYTPVTETDYESDHQNFKNDHLAPYKKYSFKTQGVPLPIPAYQVLSSAAYKGTYPYGQPAYESALYRSKRYTKTKTNKPKKAKQQEEGEDGLPNYGYLADYQSRPKDFDESGNYDTPDFSGYGDNAEQKEYQYGSDEEYGSDEYERIKALSSQEADEASKDPANCKEVKKDSMTCKVCQNPKTGGSYETCSYVSEPKNNKYAYVNEKKFDSNDEPEDDESEEQEESTQNESKQKPESEKVQKSSSLRSTPENIETLPQRGTRKFQQNSPQKVAQPQYQNYYTQPQYQVNSQNAQYKEEDEKSDEYDDQEENQEEEYDYKTAIPGFYTDNEQKKNVEYVLAEFAKKDRTGCSKHYKNNMVCYQCIDKNGHKNEECMFVSESAPKLSHLAYKEVKEFNTKPKVQATTPNSNDEAESKISNVNTSNSAPAFGTLATLNLHPTIPTIPKKKTHFKKYTQEEPEKNKNTFYPRSLPLTAEVTTVSYSQIVPAFTSNLQKPIKRSARQNNLPGAVKVEEHEVSTEALSDNIAPPSEFASAASKGAFWAETEDTYSREHGLSLPLFMLTKSEGEKYFDEHLS